DIFLEQAVDPVVFRDFLSGQVLAVARRAGVELRQAIAAAIVAGLLVLEKLDPLLRGFQDHTTFCAGFYGLLEAAKEITFVDRLEDIAAIIADQLARQGQGRAGLKAPLGANMEA